MQQDEGQFPDLPPSQNEDLKNITSLHNIISAGTKYGGPEVGQQWARIAAQAAQQNKIPLYYVDKTIQRESGWNPSAQASGSTAAGLGQFIHTTAQAQGIDPRNPEQSIQGVANYLGQLKNQTGANSLQDLSHAYVLGPTGFQQYQKTGKATGSDQLASVDKFLMDNNLMSQSPTQSAVQNSSALSALAKPMNPNNLMNYSPVETVANISSSRSGPSPIAAVQQAMQSEQNNQSNLHQQILQEMAQPISPIKEIGALSQL